MFLRMLLDDGVYVDKLTINIHRFLGVYPVT